MTPADPLIGTSIGSIRLTALLGAGAMGTVYRGRHDVLAKDVAVKVLSHARGDQAHARARFLREGQAAARISHPNVVQVFEAGVHGNLPFLVMELVVGHSLGSLLDELARKHGRPTGLPPESAARLGVGIALGLQAIHAAGVVHRDIKPDNVMVASDRTPKIADLGLAKEVADPDALRLTGTGMVVGTLLYCAPEAIRDPESIGPAADIYSLGATLYQMVSGRPPFECATAYDVMRAHLEDHPKPLRELVPGTPAALSGLVDLCLAKDPKHRPSALAVAQALGTGTALKARQRFGLTALATLACLALAGGGTGAWWLLRRGGPTVPSVPVSASLDVRCTHPAIRVKVDGGEWQRVKPGGITVEPGRRHVEAEADQPGPRLAWAKDVEIAPSSQHRIDVDLQPIRVPEVRLAVPGAGMLYVAGEANGLEPAASVTFAGIWPLARWDGTQWRTRTYVVDANGRVSQLGEGVRDQPDGDARWRQSDADGNPTPKHHVVCWWEAERARSTSGLPEPSGWREQGIHPAQPALKLNAALVEAVLARLPGVQLPDKSQATQIAARLRQPVWHRDLRGNPTLVGGGVEAVTGSLSVVPGTGR